MDPNRIYLGGHSTGGTLALLVAESTDRFRSVFAFGPTDDVRYYGEQSDFLPFDTKSEQELKVRSPIHWLSSIRTPTWVIEGGGGNSDALSAMREKNENPLVQFVEVKDANHFNVLYPLNTLIADKIIRDNGPTATIELTELDAQAAYSLQTYVPRPGVTR